MPTSTADRRPAKSAAISFPSGEKKTPPDPVRAREEPRLEARERADEDAVLRRVRLVESHEAAVGRQRHPRPLRVPGFEGEADHPRTGLLGDLLSAGEERRRAEAEREQPRRGPQEPLPARESRRRRGRCFRQPLGEQADPRLPDVPQAQLRVALEAALDAGGARSRGSPSEAPAHCGSRVRTAASTSLTVSPSKSLRPVSISKSTTPKAQMSARRSTALPRACSGDM